MNVLTLLLRLIHILSGVLWAGSAMFLLFFLGPAVQASGPDGGKVMQTLLTRTRIITALTAAAVLTAASGIWLYVRSSGGFHPAWMSTGTGITLTIGAIFGLLAFGHAASVISPTNIQMASLAREIQAGGGPPSEEQMARLQGLQAKLARNSPILTTLLILAVIFMSINEAF